MNTCPVLDLTVQNTACDIKGDGGHVLYVWTVSNPGANPVPFTWTSTSGESGAGVAPANGSTTFKSQKPESTSVTVTWGAVSTPADSANSVEIVQPVTKSVTAYPATDLLCADMDDLLVLDPYCSLNAEED